MSLQTKSFQLGKLVGAVYDFELAGDVLPMHRHTEKDVHIIIVTRGSIRLHGPEIGDEVYRAGAVIDLGVGVDHEAICMEAATRTVHIIKG
jgi:quercetin dioxygenase-like cupin family protein